MSLYSHDLVFLPPPPRSLLSFGPASKRDVLPDFATVAELKTFVARFFFYDLTFVPDVYVQMKTSTSFLCVCVVLAVLVVMRRMYERTFWIIRVIRRPTGRVLVPNSLLCFAIIEGVYALGCVALVWVIVYTHEYHIVRPFFSPLWITLPWCPLYFGALWATWGTFFATPSQLRRTANPGPKSMLHRFFNNALVTNLTGILAPLIVCASIFIPSCWSAAYFKDAQQSYDRWQTTYGDATEFSQAMVMEAQLIWFQILKANKVLAIVMIIWGAWASLLFVAYNIASVRLIKVIRRELKKSGENTQARFGISTFHRAAAGEESRQVKGSTKSSTLSNLKASHDTIATAATAMVSHPYAFQTSLPIERLVLTFNRSIDDEAIDVEKLASKEEKIFFMHRLKNVDGELAASPQVRAQRSVESRDEFWATNRLSNVCRETIDRQRSIIHVKKWTPSDIRKNWRHYMPNIVMQAGEASTYDSIHVARIVHIKQIRQAYIHVCIQYLAICPGTFVFMLIAAGIGATFYGATEIPFRGGTLFEPVLAIAITAAFWTNVVAGMCTFVALALRTYEPVFSNVQLSIRNNGGGGVAVPDSPHSRAPVKLSEARQFAKSTDYALDSFAFDDDGNNFLHMTSFPTPPSRASSRG